jgi:hypothetical protein
VGKAEMQARLALFAGAVTGPYLMMSRFASGLMRGFAEVTLLGRPPNCLRSMALAVASIWSQSDKRTIGFMMESLFSLLSAGNTKLWNGWVGTREIRTRTVNCFVSILYLCYISIFLDIRDNY